MKKAKQLFVMIPALLLGTVAVTGCKSNALGRKLDISNETDKAKLLEVVNNYETMTTSKVMDKINLGLNVNKLSAVGDMSIYQSDFDIQNPTKKTSYKRHTLKDTGFSVDSQKTAGMTIPYWTLRYLLAQEWGSGSKSTEEKDNPGDEPGEEQAAETEVLTFNSSFDPTTNGWTISGLGNVIDKESLLTNTVIPHKIRLEDDQIDYPVTEFDVDSFVYSVYNDLNAEEFIYSICFGDINELDNFSVSDRSLSLCDKGSAEQYNFATFDNLNEIDFVGNYNEISICDHFLDLESQTIEPNEKEYTLKFKNWYDYDRGVSRYSTISNVGESAFKNCVLYLYDYDYADQYIPVGQQSDGGFIIKNLGSSAFENCEFLSSMDFVHFEGDIGEKAFYNVTSDSKIDISNVDHIGINALGDSDHTPNAIFDFGEERDLACLDSEGGTEIGFFHITGDPATDTSAYFEETEQGIRPCNCYLAPGGGKLSKSNNSKVEALNNVTSFKNVLTKNSKTEPEDIDLSGLKFLYILSFPLTSDIVNYFINPELYGLSTWENMKTDFYLETSSAGNEHINFTVTCENLDKLAEEFVDKYGAPVKLPFKGEGTLTATLKTDDYGYISSFNLKVDGANTVVAIGKAASIDDSNNSNSYTSYGSGMENMFEYILETSIQQLLMGGFKFNGEVHCDVTFEANRTAASSKNAVFYEKIGTEDPKLYNSESSNYTLASQRIAYNPVSENNIVAEDPTAIYDNNNYAVRVLPKQYTDESGEKVYYKIDTENTYIAVNGVRQTFEPYTSNTEYGFNYCLYSYTKDNYSRGNGESSDALTIYLGRGLINSIRSMLGDDATFQIVVALKKGE